MVLNKAVEILAIIIIKFPQLCTFECIRGCTVNTTVYQKKFCIFFQRFIVINEKEFKNYRNDQQPNQWSVCLKVLNQQISFNGHQNGRLQRKYRLFSQNYFNALTAKADWLLNKFLISLKKLVLNF